MKPLNLIAAAALTAAVFPARAAVDFDTHFADSTLRVDYIFSGTNRTQHIAVTRLSKTDKWYGRRNNLDSLLLAGSGQLTMLDVQTGDTLFRHSFSTLFQEWQTTEEATHTERSFEAPFILQPEALFGYYQTYTHAFRALTDCSFVTIEKSEVLRLCEEFLIFRLNLLNFYTTLGQKQLRRYWRNSPTPLTQRISRFLVERCMTPTGQKSFHILMTRLADEVGDSRLDVSRALNQMQYDGLVVLHRGRIEVPQIELLAKNV